MKPMRKYFERTLLLGAFCALGVLFAHEEPKGKAITVTGEVIDTGCYVAHGGHGADHATCVAARRGQFLFRAGLVSMVARRHDGERQPPSPAAPFGLTSVAWLASVADRSL